VAHQGIDLPTDQSAASPVEVPDGPPTVEVVAVFEDAIVAVRHLVAERPFGIGRRIAARLGGGGGEPPLEFTLGPAPGCDVNLPAEAVPCARFPLVRFCGGFELRFAAGMTGEITVGGETRALADWAERERAARPCPELHRAWVTRFPAGARAWVAIGESTFLVSSVAAPRRYPRGLRLDWGQHAYTGGTALAAAAFLAILFAIPGDGRALQLDAIERARIAHVLVTPSLVPDRPLSDPLHRKLPAESGGGKRHRGPSGAAGNPRARKDQHGALAVKGPKNNPETRLAREDVARAVAETGILPLLRSHDEAMRSIFSKEATALGSDATNAMGVLLGVERGPGYGLAGLGLVGSGRGGDGDDVRAVGLGDLPGLCCGNGPGRERGYGLRAASLDERRHRVGAIEVHPEPPVVRGSLDKEIVRRVIRQHLNEVRFCYEKELARKPDLGGRVLTQFTIANTGQVLTSVVESTTLHDATVEGCITEAMRRWEFPNTTRNLVIVSYPFILVSK
jgi:hypothetical protein